MSRLRGGVLASLGALTIACFVVIGASAASSPHRAKSKFTKQDRTALARQEARGVRVVSLLIATPREGTKNRREERPRARRNGRVPKRQARLHAGASAAPQGRPSLAAGRDPDDQRRRRHSASDPPPAGSQNPTIRSRRPGGHAAGQPVHAHAGHGRGAVRQRPPDVGRPRHDDRHPRHRSRSRQPGRQRRRARASARSSTGSRTRTR